MAVKRKATKRKSTKRKGATPTNITTGDEDRIDESTSNFEQELDRVDEEIRRELHEEESVQPELPGMNPQQPVRES